MKSWTEFTQELDEASLLLIIADYNEFCKKSTIGDCFLRGKADEWAENIGNHSFTVITMRDLAFYAYQYFANRYLEDNNITV